MPSPVYSPERPQRGGFEILRVAGVPFFVDTGFLIFIALVFFYVSGSNRVSATQAGLLIFVLFFSLLGHEGGHALAARLLGCRRVSVNLVMFGGVTHHEPTTNGRGLAITLAAPLVTLCLVLVGLGALYLVPAVRASPPGEAFFNYLWVVNLIWLVFNMLPIYPMDGGQAIFHLMRFYIREHKALAIISLVSMAFCVLCAALLYLLGFHAIMAYILLVMFFVQNLALFKQFRGAR